MNGPKESLVLLSPTSPSLSTAPFSPVRSSGKVAIKLFLPPLSPSIT